MGDPLAQKKEATRRAAQRALRLQELARSYNVGISTIRRVTRAANEPYQSHAFETQISGAKPNEMHMMPNRLFHYQPFKEEHLVSLLSERKLKLSRPDRFNDPWDCRVHYQVPTDPTEIERVIQHWKAINRKHHPEISEENRALGAYNIKYNPDKLRDVIVQTEQSLYDYIRKQYRIYCLSEKSDMPLMWGHYASAHTGICLEFDTNTPFVRAITKVRYLSAYPAYNIVNADAYHALITKSADWSYEAEWRLIAEERAFARSPVTIKTDDDFLIIPSSVLKAIIIGCLSDNSTQTKIENIIRKNAPSVLVRKATLARDKYGLVITPPV